MNYADGHPLAQRQVWHPAESIGIVRNTADRLASMQGELESALTTIMHEYEIEGLFALYPHLEPYARVAYAAITKSKTERESNYE